MMGRNVVLTVLTPVLLAIGLFVGRRQNLIGRT